MINSFTLFQALRAEGEKGLFNILEDWGPYGPPTSSTCGGPAGDPLGPQKFWVRKNVGGLWPPSFWLGAPLYPFTPTHPKNQKYISIPFICHPGDCSAVENDRVIHV